MAAETAETETVDLNFGQIASIFQGCVINDWKFPSWIQNNNNKIKLRISSKFLVFGF